MPYNIKKETSNIGLRPQVGASINILCFRGQLHQRDIVVKVIDHRRIFMSDLRIQHARWQGGLVTPDDTRLEAGAKCDCVCLGCDESLILRRGEKNRPHNDHFLSMVQLVCIRSLFLLSFI